jgi:peptidoglycan/xylan/chitin deacetylase (PgdA/CDA1 family)
MSAYPSVNHPGLPFKRKREAENKLEKMGWLRTIITRPATLGLSDGQVVLTFDDGPNPHDDTTERLLDVLERNDVKACFCVVGQQALRAPDLIRRTWNAGHTLVNHSQTHPLPLLTTRRRWESEIDQWNNSLRQILEDPDFHCPLFRPPYGLLPKVLQRVVAQRKLKLVPITYYGFDTYFTPLRYEKAVDRTVKNALRENRGSYVFHDHRHRKRDSVRWADPRSRANRSWIPEAVEQVIRRLRARGCTIVDPATVEWPSNRGMARRG